MSHTLTPFAWLSMILALSACSPGEAPAPGPGGGMPPAMVSVVTLAPRDLPVSYEYTGQTAGYRDAEVRARATGILLKRLYTEGAPVKAGQVLFQIDPAPFEANLERARADQARAEADLAAARSDLERIRKDVARLKPLAEARAVSQKSLDDAVSAKSGAESRILAAEAALLASKAQVTQAGLDLGYTRVTAPIGGLSGRALKSEGSLVSGQEATLLTTVSQVHPMYVMFGISEQDMARMNADAGQGRLRLPGNGLFSVRIKLADGTLFNQTGKLTFNDPRVNPDTGTREARAEVPNPAGMLKPGQFVRVILEGAVRPNALVLPQRAILEGPQGKFVYVVNGESKAEPRPVEVGDWAGADWVILNGVQPGDRVIVDGAIKVMPGAPVQIQPETPPADASPGSPAPQTAPQT